MNPEPRWARGAMHSYRMSVRNYRRGLFYVYVAWGRAKRPLYVGKANQPTRRIGDHLLTAPWASRVQTFHCYGFETELDALVAELRAIEELNPIYNIVRNKPPVDDAEQAAIVRRIQDRKRRSAAPVESTAVGQ